MPTISIARGTDPFKKYWWVVLLSFAGIGAWVCMPLMDASIGSGSVPVQEGSLKGPQSLDSVANPSGAPGAALDLSMEGAYRKKKDGPITSSLYQPPAEEKPAEAPAAPAPAKTMADALRDVSRRSAASADPTGWGGKKAQKGFEVPKANFGGMSGLGGSSGSGASASASSFGGVAGLTGFGATKAQTTFSATRGLRDDGDTSAGGRGKAMGALENAKSVSLSAASQLSADAARAMAGGVFDGGGRGGGAIGGGAGGAAAEGGGAYGSLDAAPINLKANDPKLNQAKFEPPPTPEKEQAVDPNDQMRQQMMQMVMMMAIAGLMGGI